MSLSSVSQPETKSSQKIIRFDDFEVSWAGIHPSIDGYFLGSEDGRLRVVFDDGLVSSTKMLVDSGEAINEIAFCGNVTAASTRCEVVFHVPGSESEGGGIYEFDGGAHGVLATSAGGFVAPLGRGGLLRATIADGSELRMFVNAFPHTPTNLYKLAHLYGDGRRDVIAAASRKHGIYTFDLRADVNNGRPASSHYFKAPGLDFVDLCSLDCPERPFAIAALGADGSIHLFRDILGNELPMSFRFDNIVGSAYSILHSQGHLFLLTSKAFYTFPDFVTRFLGDFTGMAIPPYRKEELMAVDAYVARNEILIVLADCVRVESLDQLVQDSTAISQSSSNGQTINLIQPEWEISSNPMGPEEIKQPVHRPAA